MGKWRTRWLSPRYLQSDIWTRTFSCGHWHRTRSILGTRPSFSGFHAGMLPSLFGIRRSRPQILRRKVSTWHEINCTYIRKSLFLNTSSSFSYPSERSPWLPLLAITSRFLFDDWYLAGKWPLWLVFAMDTNGNWSMLGETDTLLKKGLIIIKSYTSKRIPPILFLSGSSDLVCLYLRSSFFGPGSYHEVSRHFVVGGGAGCCFVALDLLSVGGWGNGKSWVIIFIDTVDNPLINL